MPNITEVDRTIIETVSKTNPAAFLMACILRLKYPQIQEQSEYSSQAEALTILMDVAKLSREQMAFRLGLSIPMLDKATAGSAGGNLHADYLERAEALAKTCNLPVMARFFHILRVASMQNPKKIPARTSHREWWDRDRGSGM